MMAQKNLYVDIHVLQTVPPSCINRDDTGSPKTARYGGVRRARVSSQAWKKATRDEFANLLDDDKIGYRTKSVVDLVARAVMKKMPDALEDQAWKLAETAVKATGIKVKDGLTGYLVFISPLQVDALADLAIEAAKGDGKVAAKQAKTVLNIKERPTLNAVDIALFGRMVADSADLNVDAAVQVAHALGVSATEPEFDYFTAMDDLSPEDQAGAGMIGTVEFLSDTLYRYATIDVRHLYENLGSANATNQAVAAFVTAFVRSMPTGKQNTFANRTLPDAVVIQLRDTQPVSLVGAFEVPVFAAGGRGVSAVACGRLADQAMAVDEAFGTKPSETLVVCGAPGARDVLSALSEETLSMDELVARLEGAVRTYLQSINAIDGC